MKCWRSLSSFPWSDFSRPASELLTLKEKRGKAYIFYPAGYLYSALASEINATNPMDHIPGLLDFTLKSFTFKQFYKEQAMAKLRRFSSKMIKKTGVYPKDIVYVGVHNRRTDHLQYQREGGWLSLEPGYFLEALELYRQWHWEQGKRLLFLFVSDDLIWARDKLLPRIKTKGTL